MPFTDRFLKVPVEMFFVSDAEMVGYTADTKYGDSYMKINPMDISFYRPGEDNEQDPKEKNLNKTLVYFKNGESLYVNLTIKEFEKSLNDFVK